MELLRAIAALWVFARLVRTGKRNPAMLLGVPTLTWMLLPPALRELWAICVNSLGFPANVDFYIAIAAVVAVLTLAAVSHHIYSEQRDRLARRFPDIGASPKRRIGDGEP